MLIRYAFTRHFLPLLENVFGKENVMILFLHGQESIEIWCRSFAEKGPLLRQVLGIMKKAAWERPWRRSLGWGYCSGPFLSGFELVNVFNLRRPALLALQNLTGSFPRFRRE